MKKRLLAVFCYCMIIFSLTACGGKEKTDTKEYIDSSEITNLFTKPESYKGKYVKLTGKVFTAPEKSGDVVALQVFYDTQNSSQNYIVRTNSTESFDVGDYIVVDGKIDGKFEGKNMLGGKVTAPAIIDATVTKSSYIDVVAPANAEIAPKVEAEQNNFKASVDKVEYADKETRVYMTMTNNSSENVSFGEYDIRIILDGKQIEQDNQSSSVYEGDYEKLNYEVSPNASTTGILVFPKIEQNKDFQIIVPDIYSDNYEIRFTDMNLEIKGKQ